MLLLLHGSALHPVISTTSASSGGRAEKREEEDGEREREGERGRGDTLDKGYDKNHDDNGVEAVEDVGFTRKDC